VVCDLATTEELAAALNKVDSQAPRLITLFGILPNFEPAPLLLRLRSWLRPGDRLLLSANLAPGEDYAAGVRAVLPQYDNALTREWLMTLLLDLGFEAGDGGLHFAIEQDEQGLKRIVAHYALQRARTIRVYGETLHFGLNERIRLFFSYRHTIATLSRLLEKAGLEVTQNWLNESREEGVFLGQRQG
jgi:L-histidine N-alpha-methyltransferase